MNILLKTFFLLTILFNLSSCFNMCANSNEYKVVPPDGNYILYVFERNCGATSDFSTQISVLQKNRKFKNEIGNLFIAQRGNARLSDIGTILTEVTWLNNKTIIIHYDEKADVYKKVDSIHEIKIIYENI